MASEKSSPSLITVSTALPPDEAGWVKKAAEAEDRSVSNWLRRLILKAMEATQ